MIIFFEKKIEIMIDQIDSSLLAIRVMNFIEFNNGFLIFFKYIIKIYSHKIWNKSKNKHLFEIIITL